MKRGIFVSLLAAVGGCATPTTGVVPIGSDNYTVTRQGNSALTTTASLKTAALLEADKFCEGKKRPVKVIHAKEIPAGPFGRWPEAEVVFTCDAAK